MRRMTFLLLASLGYAAQIQIGHEVLDCEIADTHESRTRGLMGRTDLPEGKGMLFVFEKSRRLAFWMKDTRIPLSIGFFDENRRLTKILDMDPPVDDTYVKYRSTAPALYALEVPQGWFERHNIQIGEQFSFLESSNQVE